MPTVKIYWKRELARVEYVQVMVLQGKVKSIHEIPVNCMYPGDYFLVDGDRTKLNELLGGINTGLFAAGLMTGKEFPDTEDIRQKECKNPQCTFHYLHFFFLYNPETAPILERRDDEGRHEGYCSKWTCICACCGKEVEY